MGLRRWSGIIARSLMECGNSKLSLEDILLFEIFRLWSSRYVVEYFLILFFHPPQLLFSLNDIMKSIPVSIVYQGRTTSLLLQRGKKPLLVVENLVKLMTTTKTMSRWMIIRLFIIQVTKKVTTTVMRISSWMIRKNFPAWRQRRWRERRRQWWWEQWWKVGT